MNGIEPNGERHERYPHPRSWTTRYRISEERWLQIDGHVLVRSCVRDTTELDSARAERSGFRSFRGRRHGGSFTVPGEY